jgi:UDP-3-O-[3-hydroxymyristoyl] glucosamine N-acyltransferase
LIGLGDVAIGGMQVMDLAGGGDLTYIGSPRYADRWGDCRASAALVMRDSELEPGNGRALIKVDDVDLATAIILEHIAPPEPRPKPGVHPGAVVDEAARVDPTAAIGPGCVVGAAAVIGAGAVLQANVTVMDGAVIGEGTVLWPSVVIGQRCEVGRGCILHPNTTIGADGFGYRPAADGRGVVKIPQIGIVRLGDGVEIGANSSIDRAKFGVTEIGDGTKIDNQVQIGHNCKIGRCVVIAGCCGIAGSVEIGDGAMLGGMVGVVDHYKIGPGAKIGAYSMVNDDVPAGASWLGHPAKSGTMTLKEWAAVKRLPNLLKQLKDKG